VGDIICHGGIAIVLLTEIPTNHVVFQTEIHVDLYSSYTKRTGVMHTVV